MLVVSGLWREGFDEFMDGMVEGTNAFLVYLNAVVTPMFL